MTALTQDRVHAITTSAVGAFAAVAAARALDPSLRLPHPVFAGVAAGLAGLLPGLIARNPTHAELAEAVGTVLLGGAAATWLYEWEPQTPLQAFVRDLFLSIAIGYSARAALGQAQIPLFTVMQAQGSGLRPGVIHAT